MALSQTQVSQLYVSLFGRASEGEGNSYWQSQKNMEIAANNMLETQAAKEYFGSTLNNNQAFIEFIYENTLNKTIEQDPSGVGYWTNLLDKGWSKGSVVAEMISAINSYGPNGIYYGNATDDTKNAYDQFTNRVEISNYMADTILEAPLDWATSTSFNHDLNVTYDKSTLSDFKNIIDDFVIYTVDNTDPNNSDIVYEGLYAGRFEGDATGYISFNVEALTNNNGGILISDNDNDLDGRYTTTGFDGKEYDGILNGYWITDDLEEAASLNGFYNNITGELIAISHGDDRTLFNADFTYTDFIQGFWSSPEYFSSGVIELELVGTNNVDSYDYLSNLLT